MKPLFKIFNKMMIKANVARVWSYFDSKLEIKFKFFIYISNKIF